MTTYESGGVPKSTPPYSTMLAWAKSYVDEVLEDVARGNVMSHEEYRARVAAHFASLKG